MLCISLHVKFDGGLFISLLRKKHLFEEKKRGSKAYIFKKVLFQKRFKPRHLEKGQGTFLEKVTFFLHLIFS
jgi:hypothetical protein